MPVADFGGYEIQERIGRGAMAQVYRAVQKSLQRQVVLKVLYPHLADDEQLLSRFQREAHAAARLRHENIVQVIDFGTHEGQPFIAMEYVEGSDLRRWVDEHRTPPIEITLLILRDLCRGLEHAHARGVVHRDIKPANILFTPDGTIKIADFGLARTGSETTTMTTVGSVLGTPAYMSPEQAGGEAADERSDLFSTGVFAYELLGGHRPFGGDSDSVVMRAILTVDPPAVSTVNPLVPDGAVELVRSMLEKDVAKRCPSATKALETLEETLEKLEVRRGRELLREYAHDPGKVREALRSLRLSQHLNQGIRFESMGLGKIDDALEEFRRVLFLDPENELAQDHAHRLERERKHLVETPPRATSMPPDAGPARPQDPGTDPEVASPGPDSGSTHLPAETTPPSGGSDSTRHSLPPITSRTTGRKLRDGAKRSQPWMWVAALVAGAGLVAAAMVFWPHEPKPQEKPVAAAVPGTITDSSVTPVERAPITEPVASDSALPAPADTVEAIERARLAADSTHWWSAIIWADSAWRDPRWKTKGPDSLLRRDVRRESREIAAQGRRSVGQLANAQRIYERMLRADSTFRPRARWWTPEDSVILAAARTVVFPPPLVPAKSGFALICANPPVSVLLEGKPRGERVVCQMFDLTVGHREAVLTTADGETRRFEILVVENSVTLVAWDRAGDGGTIEVGSIPPGATVHINGNVVGITPLRLPGLPPAEYKVSLSSQRSGWSPSERQVKLKSRKTATANFKLKE